jgi:NAD(P)-dependent dehydrogenase (short-subunit alcohol dehydrogenase family)
MTNVFDLTGKVAVVTGSGRGLGKAIAIGMAAHGATVVTCSRTLAEAEAVAATITATGGTALGLRVDTSDRASCQQLIDDTVAAFGRLDVFVNNAGIDIIEPAEDVTEEAWDQVVDINLKGYFNCSQFAARQMLAQGTGGSIVNNSSIAGEVGIKGLTAYAAAKGGVNQMTKVMAVEWAPRGVRVNAFSPGYFENIMSGATDEHARPDKRAQVLQFTPMGRRGLPDELVGPVVFLASDASSYVTGAILLVDGGYTAA